MNMLDHLKSRYIDIELHHPHIDQVNGVATFYLWNLSGQLIGFQQYRPGADKTATNNCRDGRYFTHRSLPTIAVWGIESLHLTPHVLFVTEGIFDAARLTERGYSSIAVLSNSSHAELNNWLTCLNRTIVTVCDNDAAGQALAAFGDYSYTVSGTDLGNCQQAEVEYIINKFGKM